MSKPDYKPLLDSIMVQLDCLTPRCMIERIVETYGLPKRAVMTNEMMTIIIRDTLAGQTAKEIARTLSVSVPTIAAARKRLNLVKKREKVLTSIPTPLMLSGVEDRTATGLPNTP